MPASRAECNSRTLALGDIAYRLRWRRGVVNAAPASAPISFWPTRRSTLSANVDGGYAVADLRLKSLGMDHGNPSVPGGSVWFCSDEHTTFAPEEPVRVGSKLRFVPAHVDPTVAYHEAMWLVDGDEVVERWEVDLRGW